MSYVTTTKKLYSEDIEALITKITGFEKTSKQFKKCKGIAWSNVFGRYYSSVNDFEVKENLLSFCDKFVFHGFPQKAKNLKCLIDTYTNSQYFKNYASAEEKWGIIHLLIQLSRKPTDAIEDDKPISVESLQEKTINVKISEDWSSILKEGNENFCLPIDDDSLSSWSDDSEHAESIIESIHTVLEKEGPQEKTQQDLKLEALRKQEFIEEQLLKLKQRCWWKDPTFRESQTSLVPGYHRDFCFIWEAHMKKQKDIPNINIISEYKALREILWLLGSPPDKDTYLLQVSTNGFSVKPHLSIPPLSPVIFQRVITAELLRYLPSVKILMDFKGKISSLGILNKSLPTTYLAYCDGLKKLLSIYVKKIAEIEDVVIDQETYYSLRSVFNELRPWLTKLQFVASLHQKAIYSNFEQVDNWKCSTRLLCVLFNAIDNFKVEEQKLVLSLFVHSFSGYLQILGTLMSNITTADQKDEFIIKVYNGLEKRDFESFAFDEEIDPEFWKILSTICFKALSSVYFLSQFDKYSSFTKNYYSFVDLQKDFINELRESLSIGERTVEEVSSFLPLNLPEDRDIELPSFCKKIQLFGDCFDPVFEVYRTPSIPVLGASILNRFVDDLISCELPIQPNSIMIMKQICKVIEKYMEPAGFAVVDLLQENQLVQHIRCLRKVFFLDHTKKFIPTLYNMMALEQRWTFGWTNHLRTCLYEHYSPAWADKFSFSLGLRSTLMDQDALDLNFVSISYAVDPKLKSIITEECLDGYNEVFKLLIQLRLSFNYTHKLYFSVLQETPENVSRVKRLYSLRMWLIHTIMAFNNYFSFLSDDYFEYELKEICSQARCLQEISKAHFKYIERVKIRCFLKRNHPCKQPVKNLFKICKELYIAWYFLEPKKLLKDYQIKALEDDYLQVMESLALGLQIHRKKFEGDDHYFELFFDEIMSSLPQRQ